MQPQQLLAMFCSNIFQVDPSKLKELGIEIRINIKVNDNFYDIYNQRFNTIIKTVSNQNPLYLDVIYQEKPKNQNLLQSMYAKNNLSNSNGPDQITFVLNQLNFLQNRVEKLEKENFDLK